MWTLATSTALAEEFVRGIGPRWSHLCAVGQVAEALAHLDAVTDDVVSAAWVHDIGYSPEIASSGFHALDGAMALQNLGAPEPVVALVAHHTGARFEAEERGLLAEWASLPKPDPQSLAILTMIDLATGPSGQPMLDVERVGQILERYDPDHPVHRAVSRSRVELLASSGRAKALLGLPDDWPVGIGEGVSDAEPHGGVQR